MTDFTIGQTLPSLTKGPVGRQALVEWCAAENDYYDLHYDESVVAAQGLPGPPIQGTFRFALLGQMISRWAGKDAMLERIGVSYRGLDLEGDTISARGKICKIEQAGSCTRVELEIWIENQKGESSTRGTASVLFK